MSDPIYDLRKDVETYNTVMGRVFSASPDNIAALLDRLDAAERDCERYRWLRGDSCPDHSIRWTEWDVRCWVAPFWSDDLRREMLDRSIDAAMAADQPSDRREK